MRFQSRARQSPGPQPANNPSVGMATGTAFSSTAKNTIRHAYRQGAAAVVSTDEKNRLGEKLHDKEQAEEDRYFRERDRQLLGKMKSAGIAAREPDAAPAAEMRCPRCGSRLEREHLPRLELHADACSSCKGLWLERSALERALAHRRQTGWLARYFERFARR